MCSLWNLKAEHQGEPGSDLCLYLACFDYVWGEIPALSSMPRWQGPSAWTIWGRSSHCRSTLLQPNSESGRLAIENVGWKHTKMSTHFLISFLSDISNLAHILVPTVLEFPGTYSLPCHVISPDGTLINLQKCWSQIVTQRQFSLSSLRRLHYQWQYYPVLTQEIRVEYQVSLITLHIHLYVNCW